MILKGNVENRRVKNEQFQRSHLLKEDCFDSIPTNIWIIGLGGIGGHVAEIVGSIERVKKIVLFDDDIIEISNLGRTIYRYEHIETPKVNAAAEIITARNINVNVVPLKHRFDDDMANTIIEDSELYEQITTAYEKTLVIDCRDDFYNDYKSIKGIFSSSSRPVKIIRAAYDGMSVTIDVNPEKNHVWSNTGGGYEQAPSHSIPSRLAAILIITIAGIITSDFEKSEEKLNGPYTFDLWQLFDFIHRGVMTQTEQQQTA